MLARNSQVNSQLFECVNFVHLFVLYSDTRLVRIFTIWILL